MISSLRSTIAALLSAGLVFWCGVPGAHAQVVTAWSFEGVTVSGTAGTTPSVTAGGSGSNINSDQGTVSGLATALHASAATVYSTPAGNGSTKSFSSNNWAIGDYYQFATNTTGQTAMQILFDQTSSATGPTGFKVSYSTDGGTSFSDLPGGAYIDDPTVGFSAGTFKGGTPPRFLFNGGGAFDNVANLVVRLVDTTAPGGSAGTSRVDNFTFGMNLAAIPEPGSLTLCGVVGLSLLAKLRRRSALV